MLHELGVEAVEDERMNRAIDEQILQHKQLAPVAGHHGFLHQRAHRLPHRVVHPQRLGVIQNRHFVVTQKQPYAADVLRDPKVVHHLH